MEKFKIRKNVLVECYVANKDSDIKNNDLHKGSIITYKKGDWICNDLSVNKNDVYPISSDMHKNYDVLKYDSENFSIVEAGKYQQNYFWPINIKYTNDQFIKEMFNIFINDIAKFEIKDLEVDYKITISFKGNEVRFDNEYDLRTYKIIKVNKENNGN